MKKYLGIDWGEKRIGLAIGDDETKLASPFLVVGSFKEVLKTIKEENIDAVIIGVPYKMRDIRDTLSDKFKNFKKIMEKNVNVPVEYIDERLTSKAAEALPGGKKTKALRDAVAAMLILQTYFDKQ